MEEETAESAASDVRDTIDDDDDDDDFLLLCVYPFLQFQF